jgi:hypothetical protein
MASLTPLPKSWPSGSILFSKAIIFTHSSIFETSPNRSLISPKGKSDFEIQSVYLSLKNVAPLSTNLLVNKVFSGHKAEKNTESLSCSYSFSVSSLDLSSDSKVLDREVTWNLSNFLDIG